ncbi:hypothetical protein CLV92_11796 [Kineococcus xinjiangensis]|uniref:Uncharacterized protein n=1 Tax=Kineococcus xinjiangensis TaxID=512762 RepID=A0A2S6ID30_9ACTN|nr:hypothetical protein [Kineococcus xinjiangensis]PPK92128.1 hypothetical protein CLV92_11796 [Kineococcus xinjiangensis]
MPYVLGLAGALAVAGTVTWVQSQPTAEERELARQQRSTVAMQSIQWPSDFKTVSYVDGCATGQGMICFLTDRSPSEAAAVVAELIAAAPGDIEARRGMPGAPEDSLVMSGTHQGEAVSAAIAAHRLTPMDVSPGKFSGGSTVNVAHSHH